MVLDEKRVVEMAFFAKLFITHVRTRVVHDIGSNLQQYRSMHPRRPLHYTFLLHSQRSLISYPLRGRHKNNESARIKYTEPLYVYTCYL